MASSELPSYQFFSDDFVICCGSVLVRRNPSLELCIIHNSARDRWFLPKGRKDCNESILDAAARETFEETGYPCEIVPLDMTTRAPPLGYSGGDRPFRINEAQEPVAMTIRKMRRGNLKVILWFVTTVQEGAEKQADTQMANEHYESYFFPPADALRLLKLEDHKQIVRKVLKLLEKPSNAQRLQSNSRSSSQSSDPEGFEETGVR